MNSQHFAFELGKKSDNQYQVRLTKQDVEIDFAVRLFLDGHYSFPYRPDFDSDIALDLLDLAIAIYTADWHSKRTHDIQTDIYITLPVRHPEFWKSATIQDQLERILHWYTEDNWRFSYTTAEHNAGMVQAVKLPLLAQREVALWSGGLDSFAGLIHRLKSRSAEEYLLFGTGSNSFIHGKQKRLIHGNRHLQGLRGIFGGKVGYQRLLIQFRRSTNIANNPEFRARGLVFILLGAVAAYLEGQNTLHIYENGIGAINLPLSAAEVGLDHARSVHPKSVLYIENFLKYIFGDFRVINPFWDKTKGQMCIDIASEPNLMKLAFQTVTCDGLTRVKGRQCGYCTSCLMRRQALLSAGIDDQTKYGSDSGNFAQDWDIAFRAVSNQISDLRILLNNRDPKSLFHKFVTLTEIAHCIAKHMGITPENAKDRLYRLYRQYVSEWESVEPILIDKLMLNSITVLTDRP